jgi:hypothetical protein
MSADLGIFDNEGVTGSTGLRRWPMRTIFIAWLVCMAGVVSLAVAVGRRASRARPDDGVEVGGAAWARIFIDSRGRYSLSRGQVVLWTLLVLGLIGGVLFARLYQDLFQGGLPEGQNAFDFRIPGELLGLLGISLGSAVVAGAVKGAKDADPDQAALIAANDAHHPPRPVQILLVEQGPLANQTIDIGKFQNAILTAFLLVAYAVQTIEAIRAVRTPGELTALPGFGGQFLTLLGLSHAGYIAAKLPSAPTTTQPPDFTVSALHRRELRHGAPTRGRPEPPPTPRESPEEPDNQPVPGSPGAPQRP